MSRRGWIVVGAVVGVWLLVLVGIGAVAITAVADLGQAGDWDEALILGEGPQKVVVIQVAGEIHTGSGGGSFGPTAGSRDIVSQLRQAEEDPDVAAIVIRLETPGGGVVASDEIYRATRRVGESKPVVASMGDLAASGGYYVAAATQRIVANPATLTGSIGVIMILPNLEGTAEKLGIRPVVLTAGENKDEGSMFREMDPEERAHFQRLLDEAHTRFIEAVAEGRGVEPDEIRPAATGRAYSGTQAHDLGLVDEFGDLEDAYRAALELAQLDEDRSRLVEYRAPPGLGDLFGSPFFRSPVEEVKRELGIGFGLKYLYLP